MSHGITKATADSITLVAEQLDVPSLGLTAAHKQLIGLMAGTVGDPQTIGATNNALDVNLKSALSAAFDSVLTYARGNNYQILTASGQVLATQGKIDKIIVCSVTGTPSIKAWDSLTPTGNVALDTTAVLAKDQIDLKNERLGTGLYMTITGTATILVLFDPTTTVL
jgi:hypothetical protein